MPAIESRPENILRLLARVISTRHVPCYRFLVYLSHRASPALPPHFPSHFLWHWHPGLSHGDIHLIIARFPDSTRLMRITIRKDMLLSSSKKIMQCLALLVLCAGFSLPAYGYIDPGTGSLIIQGVIGAIAAVGVTMKLYWHKIKVFLSRKGSDLGAENPTDEKAED